MLGNHWHAIKQRRPNIWLYHIDADYFKNLIQNGLMTPEKRPGSITLFGPDPVLHRDFAEQICSEVWTREYKAPRGWKEGFVVKYHRNHFLDAAMEAAAGAAIKGLTIREQEKEEIVSLSKIQKERDRYRD